MDITCEYQLFLFDLDGLLVNTEELHFRAYMQMLAARGFILDWDFATYFQIAQQDAGAPEREIYKKFPKLYEMEPSWAVLYSEKKQAYKKILENEPAPLLEGVDRLLTLLHEHNTKRAVVTHTSRSLVDIIRSQNPLLNTIEHWFCREDYKEPKPSPDGYLKAIDTLASPSCKIIGFEDSYRGMRSLMATRAKPVLVNSHDEALRQTFQKQGVLTFSSFNNLLS